MTKRTIERINKDYLTDECAEVFIPYSDSLTVIGNGKVLYHRVPGSHEIHNDYFSDPRRMNFPYSNISEHIERNHLMKRITYVNQLLDFNKLYVCIGDNAIKEKLVLKDKTSDEAVLLTTKSEFEGKTYDVVDRETLERMFLPTMNKEKVFIMNSYGTFIDPGEQILIPSEEDILYIVKNRLMNEQAALESALGTKNEVLSDTAMKFLKYNINKMSLEDIPPQTEFMQKDLLIIRLYESIITMSRINVHFLKHNSYAVVKEYLPLNKYMLSSVKELVLKSKEMKEPNIKASLNPNIKKEEIAIAKLLKK